MHISPIPSPSEIRQLLAPSPQAEHFLHEARATARRVVLQKDARRAFVMGPCSIHDKASAIEYARRFKQLMCEVENNCFLVMRVYVEKSRTSTGWKGLLYDPHLDDSHDMRTGILWTRELLLALAELGVPTAAEFVDPLAALYFEDLITWGFIGARTSASQIHRQFASGSDIPIGFKNGTDGNLDDAVYGVLVSRIGHTFLSANPQGMLSLMRSTGNPYTHVVLRGAHHFTNYDAQPVNDTLLKMANIPLSSRLLIDCSHGNCQKQCDRQKDVFHSVLEQWEMGSDAICGLMLESHLESGSQSLKDPQFLKSGVSITDPCIDWETTEYLMQLAYQSLNSSSSTVMSLTHN